MTKLSPAALAVMDAIVKVYPAFPDEVAAATLRAVAEIVAPVSYEDIYTDGRVLQYEKENPIREKLLAIADELDVQYSINQ
jgi:hypothetical protein